MNLQRWHGLPIQIWSKFVRDFSGMCFFLIENIDMILTLIHKRKGKRKTGNKKEHIVPVLVSDMTFKIPSHNNTSEPLRAFKPTASVSHALYRFLIRTWISL